MFVLGYIKGMLGRICGDSQLFIPEKKTTTNYQLFGRAGTERLQTSTTVRQNVPRTNIPCVCPFLVVRPEKDN